MDSRSEGSLCKFETSLKSISGMTASILHTLSPCLRSASRFACRSTLLRSKHEAAQCSINAQINRILMKQQRITRCECVVKYKLSSKNVCASVFMLYNSHHVITIIPIIVVSTRCEQVRNREIFNLLSGSTYFPYIIESTYYCVMFRTMPVGLVNNLSHNVSPLEWFVNPLK